MKLETRLFMLVGALFFQFSCAPVKFTKSDELKIDANTGNQGTASFVSCRPEIVPNQTTYTYSSTGAVNLASNCTPTAVIYEWTVKRSDSSVVAASVPNLSGANPQNIDLRFLGAGTYYVFLTARDSSGSLQPFTTTQPLELVVPGSQIGNSLTCEPKININYTSVILNPTDTNPTITANCSPQAGMYLWTVTKDNVATTISGLSGESSTPQLQNYGAGVYRIHLYATTSGSAHWQSTTPLTITINQPAPPVPNPILCNPKINGSLNSVTLNSSSTNPLISSNCVPSDATHQWRVTLNGQTVNVGDLTDATSNANFMSLPNGTYLIYLTASKTNFQNWSTTTPLTVTVDKTTAPQLTLNCGPRLNSDSTAITITTQEGNPTLAARCTPQETATYSWTVYRNGEVVTINQLAGAESTPDFLSAGLGTYYIYLTASAPGYNSYVIPAPLEVTVATVDSIYRRVTLNKIVEPTQNQVDILLVVDDSKSMLEDNRKLAQKLQGFVTDLGVAGVDWKMCATVTRAQDVYNNGKLYWGASRNWINYVGTPAWILNRGVTDPYSIFTATIENIGAGWAGTDDERGIKAAYWHTEYSQYNTCYRDEASLSVIMISDEDERSVGGDKSVAYYPDETKPLEADDLASSYVNKVKQKFGLDKRLTVNSIIVKPQDTTCMSAQDANGQSKSHYGYQYDELSRLTNGFSSSICAADYSANLNYFKERIINNLSSIPLECAPVGQIEVSVTPSMGGVSTRLENNNLVFTPAVPKGHTISLGYNCPRN